MAYELSVEEQALLAAVQQGIANRPRRHGLAWSKREALEAQGHQPQVIDRLVALGWLTLWTVGDGCRVTFTPLAQYRLNLEIIERGVKEIPTWQLVPPGKPKRRPIRILGSWAIPQEILELQPAPDDDPTDVVTDSWSGEPIRL